MTNRAWVCIGSLLLLISFSVGLIIFDPPTTVSSLPTVVTPSISPSPPHITTETASSAAQFYLVTKVVDGDTIKVDLDGIEETVRLVGINTPETVDPRRAVECFGTEASIFVKNLLEGQSVRLENDATQSNRDRYDRLLRFVFLPDGTDVGKLLIEQGFAHESLYSSTPHQYRAEYVVAEQQAKELQKGLWNPTTCPVSAI